MKVSVSPGKQVWQSPDGQRTIYQVTASDGTVYKTFSGAIAKGGEFEVETYTKPNDQFTYIKQEKKFNGGGRFDSEGARWGNALNVAVLIEQHKLNKDNVLEIAKHLYANAPVSDQPTKASTPDIPSHEPDEPEPDLQDLPF